MPEAVPIDEDAVPIIAEICDFIRANLDARLTLTALSKRSGMSPGHFQRVFKRVVGVSPRQFADACRLKSLKAGLKGGHSVTTAMLTAGYGSSSRLYERAAGQLGMTPGQYRKGAPRIVVRYTSAACDLGRVLLAATERGVCAVSLADTDGELLTFLRGEFPEAEIEHDAAGLQSWLRALLDHLSGNLPHLSLPLDVQATAFQRRVWEELQSIPYGQTRTYKQVAEAIGDSNAVRAVARACATNPTSIVVPCHRVVGSDGKLTGYRWGIGRKKRLLQVEQESAKGATKK